MNMFEEMKERVSMRDVLEMYGVHPTRGKNIYRCPFHNDNKPSANVCRDGKIFRCFTENKAWDIFDFVREMDGCDLKTAMKTIDTKFGLGLLGELTHKEKLELARQRKERERQRAEKEWWKRFEEQVLNEILRWHRFCEQVLDRTEIKRGQYREKWDGDLYFYTLRKSMWLDWLYLAICGREHEECIFDLIYGTDKTELLQKIKNKEIEIF